MPLQRWHETRMTGRLPVERPLTPFAASERHVGTAMLSWLLRWTRECVPDPVFEPSHRAPRLAVAPEGDTFVVVEPVEETPAAEVRFVLNWQGRVPVQ